MTKLATKEQAILLRTEQHLPYSQIAKALGVSKGSLSRWLKSYPVPNKIAAELMMRTNPRPRGKPLKSWLPCSKFYEAIDPTTLTNNRKAKIAEAAVLFRLALHDFIPFTSVFDGDKTDWLVKDPNGNLHKIEVRWAAKARPGRGLPHFKATCSDGRRKYRKYLASEVDFIVAYDLWSDTAHVFNFSEVAGKATKALSLDSVERWDKIWRAVRDSNP